MRLPQSITGHLSVHTITLITATLAVLVVLMSASAAGQLVCTPTSLPFGTTVVGQTETLHFTMANSGQSSVSISAIKVGDAEFSVSNISLPLILAAGQSVDAAVNFTPTTTGWKGTRISIVNDASNPPLRLQAWGSGTTSQPVIANPPSLSYGQVAVGGSSTSAVVLTNTRPWSITLSQLQTSGGVFSATGPAFPVNLGAGQSITLNVTFAPQTSGPAGGSVLISGSGLAIPLAGTGTTLAVGQLVVNPASTNFGNVMLGTTATQSITLNASGASVTVSSSASSSSQFVLQGAAFPLSIPAGQSASFNVAFTPTASGNTAGSLSFASNASDSTALASLSGMGTTPQYNVGLSWSPSTSSVSGYNVYRGTSANGAYSRLNSTLNPNTAYSDTTVVSGQTYYYAATAVSSNGEESAYSAPVKVAIP